MQTGKARLTAYLRTEEHSELKRRSCIALYRSTGEEACREYVLAHMDKNSGMSLLFAWNETQDPAYRQAMDELAGRLPEISDAQDLYQYVPFRAAYDVRFGGRKDARRIAELFLSRQEQLSDPWYFLALADCVEQMDIQLYEHYRALADLLLASAQRILRKKVMNSAECCLLMKGTRLGLLDPERYLPRAIESFGALEWDAFYPLALAEYRRMNA